MRRSVAYLLPILVSFLFVNLQAISCGLSPAAGQMQQNEKEKLIALKNKKQWKAKRKRILEGMQKVMGPLPEIKGLPVPVATFLDTLRGSAFDRYTVHISSYPGETVPVLLYIPKKLKPGAKVPAVIALHGTGAKGKHLTDSLSAPANRATATELAWRGYIVLAPDYPSFGELSGHRFSDDRFESGAMQGVFNHIRCLDYLESRPDVDPERLGVIGHSLGGHSAMFLGAFDERVKMVVSSCGWTLFDYYDAGERATDLYGGKLGPWAQERYMPFVKTRYDLNPKKMPFDFDEVVASIAPRHFFSNSPVNDGNFNVDGVREGIRQAQHVYGLLGVTGHLQVRYPDAGHDFPTGIRQDAYEALDSVLKNQLNDQKQ